MMEKFYDIFYVPLLQKLFIFENLWINYWKYTEKLFQVGSVKILYASQIYLSIFRIKMPGVIFWFNAPL